MSETELGRIEQALAENGEVAVCTHGYSMYPMLRHRKDVSTIRIVDRPFRVNDVPVYRTKSGKLIMHRIIAIKNGRYIIRGDNLLVKETNVTDEKIIGRLVAFYRDGKYYDCEKSKAYKFYVRSLKYTYPFRFVWKKLFSKYFRWILAKVRKHKEKKK